MEENKINTSVDCFTALDLHCGKGMTKKWALEDVILKCLYDTKPDYARYIKLEDTSNLVHSPNDTEEEFIIPFGYQFRLPKTEIDLHIVKKSGMLYITRPNDFGYGWYDVEEALMKFIFEEKKRGNLYYQTNFDDEKYKI